MASVKLINISSIAPNSTGQIEIPSDLNLIGTPPPVYRINGVPIGTGGGGMSQTPWESNIDAANYSLGNVSSIGIAIPASGPTGTAGLWLIADTLEGVVRAGGRLTLVGMGIWISPVPAGETLLDVGRNETNLQGKLNIIRTIDGPPSTVSDANNILTLRNSTGVELAFGLSAMATSGPAWIQTKDANNAGQSYPLALNPLGGNVGIGTTAPRAVLDIAAGNQPYGSPGAAGGAFRVAAGAGSNDTAIFMGVDTTLNSGWIQSVEPGSTTRALLLNAMGGNVGIGSEASPNTRLMISSQDNSTPQIALRPSDGNYAYGLAVGFSVINGAWRGYLQNYENNAASHILVNPYGGAVSVGTATVCDQLNIDGMGPNGFGQLRMVHGGYGAFFRNDGNTFFLMVTNPGDPWGTWKVPWPIQVDMATAVTSLYQLNVNNNLSVGMNNSSYRLHMVGPGQDGASDLYWPLSGQGATLYLHDDLGSAGNGGAVMFGSAFGPHAAIKSYVTSGAGPTGFLNFYMRPTDGDSAFYRRMTLDPSGNLSFTGNLRIADVHGTATANFGNSGHNITWDGGNFVFSYGIWVAASGLTIANGNLNTVGTINCSGGYYLNGVPLAASIGPTNHQAGNRAVNTVYQNNTGKPMWVLILAGGNGWILRSDAGNPPNAIMGTFLATGFSIMILVLPGWYYMLDTQSLPGSLNYWHEWW